MKKKLAIVITALAMLMSFAGAALANHTPTVSITSPSDGAALAAGTTNVDIEGTAGGSNPARLKVTVNGVEVYDSVDNINGTWSFNHDGLANGESYTVVATATHSGNVNTATIEFRVDTPITQRANPEVKEDCDNDGWIGYAFKNHGQCVRYVAAGKDSR